MDSATCGKIATRHPSCHPPIRAFMRSCALVRQEVGGVCTSLPCRQISRRLHEYVRKSSTRGYRTSLDATRESGYASRVADLRPFRAYRPPPALAAEVAE